MTSSRSACSAPPPTWRSSTPSGASSTGSCGLDPARARRLVPLRAKQQLYDVMLNRYRADDDPRAAAITPDDFFVRDTDLDAALDVIAVCRA